MSKKIQRDKFVNSLEQLTTMSGLLAGFSFGGLIALPSLSPKLFKYITDLLGGTFAQAFYISFYSLFFASIGFIFTIIIVMTYKINGYMIPFNKLRRVHFISNMIFSFAIAALLISVITFAIPSMEGIIISFALGIGAAGSFLWENMLPAMRRKREAQMKAEEEEEFVAVTSEDKKE